jgi:hypothetical protein
MSEETKKPTTKDLESEVAKLQEDLQKVYAIANSYIKAHRDLVSQLNSVAGTAVTMESLLAEKLK